MLKAFGRSTSGILALLAPPVAPNLAIPTTIVKGQQPLALHQHHCLPSKKGEVLLLGQVEPTMVGIVNAQKF